jgi:hypothetical protein
MTHARLSRRTGAAVTVFTIVAAATLFPAGGASAGEEGLAKLGVVEAHATGAVVGVVTRVPAESPGGGAYTETKITPDKAIGRAAGFTPGPLAETFAGTSVEGYRNPSMVAAQQPEGHFPAESQAEGSQSGAAGSFGAIRAKAVSRSEVTAEAVMAAGPPTAPITVEGGLSRSHSLVEPDGTVLTQVEVTFGRVLAGDVLEIIGGRSRAVARTPAGGRPTLELETTLGRMTVNGVAAELSEAGLTVADQQPVTAAQTAQFNAGLAQLRQAGITLEAVPAQREERDGTGRIAGAAGLLRYQLPATPVPNSIGNDEEFMLASVSATAVAVPLAEPEPLPLPDLGLPMLPGSPLPAGTAAAESSVQSLVAGGAPLAVDSDTGSSTFFPGSTSAPVADPDMPTTNAPTEAPASSSPDNAELAVPLAANLSLVAGLTGFSALLVMVAAGAAALLLALHKFRT